MLGIAPPHWLKKDFDPSFGGGKHVRTWVFRLTQSWNTTEHTLHVISFGSDIAVTSVGLSTISFLARNKFESGASHFNFTPWSLYAPLLSFSKLSSNCCLADRIHPMNNRSFGLRIVCWRPSFPLTTAQTKVLVFFMGFQPKAFQPLFQLIIIKWVIIFITISPFVLVHIKP